MSIFSSSPNRYMCSALEEMREQLKVLDENNIARYRSITSMLIEEIQTMGNRMEAGLEDKQDLATLTEKRSKLRKEVRALKAEKAALNGTDEEDD